MNYNEMSDKRKRDVLRSEIYNYIYDAPVEIGEEILEYLRENYLTDTERQAKADEEKKAKAKRK